MEERTYHLGSLDLDSSSIALHKLRLATSHMPSIRKHHHANPGMRVLVPLDNRLALVCHLSLLGLVSFKATDGLFRGQWWLNRRVPNGIQTVRTKLDVGVRDFIVHGRHELDARNVADNLEDLGRVPKVINEWRVARRHATDLDGARARVVHAVVQHFAAEDVAAVLEDCLVGEEGEWFRRGDRREGCWLQLQVLHCEY